MTPLEAELRRLAERVLAYDEAIRSCADDPDRMASFCTAQGDDLDSLYADMIMSADLVRDHFAREGGE